MRFHLEIFSVVIFTFVTQSETASQKRPPAKSFTNEDVQKSVRGELADFFGGPELGNKIGSEMHTFILNTEKCRAQQRGRDMVYDIDSKTCRDCFDENCTNDAACRAQCYNLRRISKLESDNRNMNAEMQQLNLKMIGVIVALVVIGLIGVLWMVHRGYMWYQSRCDKREAPEADKKPFEEELLQRGQQAEQV